MNKELELHDSTLSKIEKIDDNIILILDSAIAHHSEGTPAIDDGTCWKQKIEIILSNAILKIKPKEIPNEIIDGYLIVNEKKYDNMFKTSLNVSGNIILDITTGRNENLNIEAKHIEINEIENPVYIQDFHRKNKKENKMKIKLILIALCFAVAINVAFSQTENDPKYKINPTPNKESSTEVYIPKDLEDCFKELKSMLYPDLIKEMTMGTENDMIKYHHGLGMWIRNNWGLWSESRLKEYFNELGIQHPDDMSGIILDSFWRHLNNKPIELEEQIKYYQEYWGKINL